MDERADRCWCGWCVSLAERRTDQCFGSWVGAAVPAMGCAGCVADAQRDLRERGGNIWGRAASPTGATTRNLGALRAAIGPCCPGGRVSLQRNAK